jgi:hypothetical protein
MLTFPYSFFHKIEQYLCRHNRGNRIMAEIAQKEFKLSDEVKQFYFDTMAGDYIDIGSVRLKADDPKHLDAFSQYMDMICEENEALVEFLNTEYAVFQNFMAGFMPDEQSFEYREMEDRFRKAATWITGPNNYAEVQNFEQILERGAQGPVRGLTTEALDFYYDSMADLEMDLNGIKLDVNNDAQRAAFHDFANDICARTPAVAGLMLDAFTRIKTYETSMPEGMEIDPESERYERLQDAVFRASEELESIAELENTNLSDFAPEGVEFALAPNKPAPYILTNPLPAETSEDIPAQIAEELEAGIAEALAEGIAASEMSREEIEALEAQAQSGEIIDAGEQTGNDITYDGLIEETKAGAPVLRATRGVVEPASGFIPVGPATAPEANPNAPSVGPATPPEANPNAPSVGSATPPPIVEPEGGFREVGPAIPREAHREPSDADYDGITIDGTLAAEEAVSLQAPTEDEIVDAVTQIEVPERFIWEMSDHELQAVFDSDEARQDEFIKKAIADWYLCVGKETELDQDSVDIAFAHLMANNKRVDILNNIYDDVTDRRQQQAIITEFDHAIIDNHISFDPEVIDREVKELAQGDAQRAKRSKIMSWAVPAAGGIAAGVATGLLVKGGLAAATGGSSAIIGGIGGGLSALASEYARLSIKANQIQKDNPKLTGHTQTRLMQEAIKADNVKIAKDRLQKTQDKIKALESKIKTDTHDLRVELEESRGRPSKEMNALAKANSKDQDKLTRLKNQRLKQFASLKQVQFDSAEDYSIGKHMIKRTMMGAVLGAGLGAVMSMEPVQNALSDGFNAVSGFLSSLAAPAAEQSVVNAADVGLNNQFFDALLAQDAIVPDAGFVPPSDAAQTALDTALAAADNQTVIAITPEANTVIQQFGDSGIPLLELGSAVDALDAHFGGDVPDRFAPYIANLDSDNLAYRNEALHSIAYLLNNAGEQDMAKAFMALNIMENGFDSPDPAVVRSIEGLTHYGDDLSQALSAAAAGDVDFTELRAMAESAAAGDISLTVHDPQAPQTKTAFTPS